VVIVYFGTPAFAVPSLEALLGSRHRVAALVSQPDRPRGRGQQLQPTPTKAIAEPLGIPVLQPNRIRDEWFLQQLRDLRPDLGVVAAFGRILPDDLLVIPRFGLINVHASLLPRYRGAAPIPRAIMAGERKTGVTIMRIVRELDAGPTYASRAVPIPVDATSGDVEGVLARIGADLLVDVLDRIDTGRAREMPQDEAQATYAPKLTKDEGVIDWTQPARRIHDLVRALQPWPLASTTLGESRYVVRRTAFGEGMTDMPAGTVVRADGDDLVIACGGGSVLRVLEIQPEGRRVMSAREFLAGHTLATGDRFGP
jgi:methionyl-tRNA formyltransferase